MTTLLNPFRVVIGTSTGTVADGGLLTTVQATANAALPTASVGVANGAASLDATGKLPASQLPSAIVGAVVFQGTWNANANTPALASGTGTKGFYYKVSVAGSTTVDGISQWNVGDTIIFDGLTWDKIDGVANEVLSVAGRTGSVTLAVADVAGAAALASPTFTGIPVAPTPATADNSTKLATTAYVQAQSYATTTALASYAPISSPTFTGTVTLPALVVSGGTISSGGAGAVSVLNTNGTILTLAAPTASTVNGVKISGSATGTAPTVAAQGGDANLDLTLTGAGTGLVRVAGTIGAGDSSTAAATTAWVSAKAYAPLASPTFTGIAAAPTPTAGDNSTKLATTAFVAASFAPLASPALTGAPTAPTPTAGDSTTKLATTAFVAASFAPLASPTFTGTTAAPTPTAGDNSTKLATTAFVAASFAPLASPTFTGTVTLSAAVTAPAGGVSLNTANGKVAYLYAPAASVNSIGLNGAATGGTVTLSPLAGDANQNLGIYGLGTGAVITNTPTAGDYSTKLATTAFVGASFAPLASPTFTGTVSLSTLSGPVGGLLVNTTNGTSGYFYAAASSVNGVSLNGAATAAVPNVAAFGADSNMNLGVYGKGTGYAVTNNNAPLGDNSTALATTYWVKANIGIAGSIAGLDSFGNVSKSNGGQSVGLRAVSTTTTPVRLTSDGAGAGASNSLPMATGSVMSVEGRIVARNTSTNDSISYDLSYTIRRNATGVPVFSPAGVAQTVFDQDSTMAACALTVTIDSTNNCVWIGGTGLASTTINWTAVLLVTYAN